MADESKEATAPEVDTPETNTGAAEEKPEEKGQPQRQEKTFTQTELDGIIESRLKVYAFP